MVSDSCTVPTVLLTSKGTSEQKHLSEKQLTESCLRSLRNRLGVLHDMSAESPGYRTGERTFGTSEWLLETNEMQDWLRKPGQACWITASPGRGKTVLASYLVQQLRQDNRTKVIHFFCDLTSGSKAIHGMDALLSLLWQLLMEPNDDLGSAAIPAVLLSAFQIHGGDLFEQSSFLKVLSIFKRLAEHSQLGDICCVLDGIDECDTESMQQLLRMMTGMLGSDKQGQDSPFPFFSASDSSSSTSNSTFRLAVFSRREEVHRFDYHLFEAKRIDIESQYAMNMQQDVRTFLKSSIKNLAGRKDWSDHLKEQVEAELIRQSEDTFLWVSLIIRELSNSPPAEVLWAIRRTPHGLTDLCRQLLKRLLSAFSDLGRTAVKWVLCSRRRLSVDELNDVLDASALDSDNPRDRVQDAVALSYGFLQICPRSTGGSEVSVCHASVSEFFRTAHDHSSSFHPARIDLDISRYCLIYLERTLLCHDARSAVEKTWRSMQEAIFDRFVQEMQEHTQKSPVKGIVDLFELVWPSYANEEDDSVSMLIQESDLKAHPVPKYSFFWYAVKWWSWHIQQCDCRDASFLLQRQSLLMWFLYNGRGGYWHEQYVDAESTESSLTNDDESTTPARSNNDQPSISRLRAKDRFMRELRPLFEGDLNKYGLGKHWWRMFAMITPDRDIIEPPFTILHLSTHLQLSALTDLILGGKLAEITPKNQRKRLMTLHEMINAEDGLGLTPLMLCARAGDVDTLRRLLDLGADVGRMNLRDDTALHLAAISNRAKCISALLDASADVQCTNRHHKTPMDHAIMSRGQDAIRALSENTASLNPVSKGAEFVSIAIHTAAHYGDYELTQLLLELGADPQRRDRYGNTALHVLARSSFNGNDTQLLPPHLVQAHPLSSMVNLLVEHGITKDSRNNEEQTPLMFAAAWANTSVLKALLNDMDPSYVNAKDNHGLTAFLCGCYQAQFMTIYDMEMLSKLTLDTQVRFSKMMKQEINGQYHGDVLGPLMCSKYMWRRRYREGHVDEDIQLSSPVTTPLYGPIVDALTKAGADMSVEIYGLTGLHLALLQPYDTRAELVQILLHHAPDLASVDSPLGLPSHIAASRGCVLALDALLKAGANLDALDMDGKSMLHHAISHVCVQSPTALKWSGVLFDVIIEQMGSTAKSIIDDAKLVHLSLSCSHRRNVLKRLLDRKADRLLKDNFGNIPLHYAAALAGADTIELLLSGVKKAKKLRAMELCNNEGYNAVTIAILNGNIDATRKLCAIYPQELLAESVVKAGKVPELMECMQKNGVGTGSSLSSCSTALLERLTKHQAEKVRNIEDPNQYWMFNVTNCEFVFPTLDLSRSIYYWLAAARALAYRIDSQMDVLSPRKIQARSVDILGLFYNPATRVGHPMPCSFRNDHCCAWHRDSRHLRPLGLNLDSGNRESAAWAEKMSVAIAKTMAPLLQALAAAEAEKADTGS